MRIDADGNVGIGQAPNMKLNILHADQDGLRFNTANNAETFIDFGDTDDNDIGRISYDHADNSMSFRTNNSNDRLVIDSSGNVGIGTTPSYNLDIVGTLRLQQSGSDLFSTIRGPLNRDLRIDINANGDTDGLVVRDLRDDSERFRVQADGKVGIGTTSPNDELDIAAVHSQLRLTDTDDSKFVQFSYSGGKLVTRNNDASTTVNQFTLTEDGKFGIGTISPDTLLHINNLPDDKFMTFEQNGRKHAIGTYFSSNANDSRLEFYMSDGNTNGSNNNRLTIKGNGNVGIGTASPTKPLSVYAGDANGNIVLTRAGTSENLTLGTYYITATSNDLQLASSAGKMTFSAGGSERMRIESNGKVGINNTDPTGYYSDNLVVGSDDEGGITIASSASSHKSYLMFADGTSGSAAYRGSVGYDHNLDSLSLGTGGGTNRLTIDGSGRTGIGTTTTGGARLTVEEGDNTKIGAYIVNSSTAIANSSASLLYLQATGDAAIGDGYKLVQFADSDTVLGTISSASSSSAVAYNTTSDERLKENIVDMPSQIENILKVQPRQFDWKKNGNTSKGFVAQELHKIYPEAVTVGLEDETQDPWSVDYGRLTPFIIKAIQEQQEQIEQLKTEIQAIKDKHPKG